MFKKKNQVFIESSLHTHIESLSRWDVSTHCEAAPSNDQMMIKSTKEPSLSGRTGVAFQKYPRRALILRYVLKRRQPPFSVGTGGFA